VSIGVHKFDMPHDKVQPTRDMVIIRVPSPPKTVGYKVKFIVPDQSRELAQHNVTYGVIMAMGPMAFAYKDGEGLSRQEAAIGDWCLIRPFAGTLVAGGKLVSTFGWRYVSSYQDVIGVLKAEHMPPVDAFEWDDQAPEPVSFVQPELPLEAEKLPDGVRERVTYPAKGA
jgi:hypothetical protein